jgi:hypothetical protein
MIKMAIVLVLVLASSICAEDLFTTASIETYRTDLGTTMISPNVYCQYGRFEIYGFIDQYFEEPKFYHGELMFTYQLSTTKHFDRVYLIAEQRWDRFAENESSIGLKFKLW